MKRRDDPASTDPVVETRDRSESVKSIGSSRAKLAAEGLVLDSLDADQLRDIALSPGLQALWQAVLPLVGILPSKPNEYPGVFRVEPGPADDEATVYVDIPTDRYESGKAPKMSRVVSLTIKLSHDYRLLGDRYFCVDCEPASDETRH